MVRTRSLYRCGWIECKFTYFCLWYVLLFSYDIMTIYSLYTTTYSNSRSNRTQEEKEDASEEPKKKYRSNKKFVKDYPHRLERLAELGVIFESHHENKWETMFQKLCIYKEEHGTLRFPSEDQCIATGDPELIALQKWVKRQVNAFRYGKKGNPEIVKRLLDIGFDFEKWYARPCKVKKMKGEELKKFNEIAKSTVNGMELDENDDKKMPAKEDVGDLDMKIGASEEV